LFVEALYADVLGRAAGPSEGAPWVRLLQAGVSPAAVADGILASPEALAGLVERAYADYLGRAPDPAGAQAQSGLLLAAGPAGADALAARILASDEFFLRAASGLV
jgi:hypothetical protein